MPEYKRTSVFQLQAATRHERKASLHWHPSPSWHFESPARSRQSVRLRINRFPVSSSHGQYSNSNRDICYKTTFSQMVRCRSCWVCGVASFETVFHVQYCSPPSSLLVCRRPGISRASMSRERQSLHRQVSHLHPRLMSDAFEKCPINHQNLLKNTSIRASPPVHSASEHSWMLTPKVTNIVLIATLDFRSTQFDCGNR